MKKALLAMLELLSQFECETKSVFAKVFNDRDGGLVELHDCLKTFLPGWVTSTCNNNDCESISDIDVRCNADALISRTAQELAASAHIDLSSDEAVILDDSDSDDDKCDDSLVLTDVDFTEGAVLVELEKPKLSILSLQMIMEKQVTDPDLIHLMADSCALMEMKCREQCSF